MYRYINGHMVLTGSDDAKALKVNECPLSDPEHFC
jgi:hypothetical protein